ncbi:carboxymuconolactone decarboxylase family protein [Streptomyces sp. NPDC093598]|uniref:carboxymuconolactone decarboxylase family protein n=1 Tax=Streptomyces sp. NPDC093598 TaxID=3366046 RepID=UPI0038220FC0
MTARTELLDPAVGRALSALTTAKKCLGDPALAELVGLSSAWEEAEQVFDERERAAPALTEAVTVLTEGFGPDEVYERAAKHFDETRLTHLIALIVAVNNWNRVMVSRRIPPGGYTP